MKKPITILSSILLGATIAGAQDTNTEWTQWGRDATNNMYSPAKNIPVDFTSGEVVDGGKVEGAKHAKWVVELGSQSYGTPTIKDGRVFVGTNNEEPRLEHVKGDRGVVMAFDEASGKFLWQLSVPKLGAGKVSDWEFLGMCSSLTVEGKHGYIVTNRGEIVCIDVYGMSDGNDGPFQDEAKYMTGGLSGLEKAEPAEMNEQDADIIWAYDIRTNLGAFPHNITSSSVVLSEDRVWASTSNGVDWSHINIPAPTAPSLIALDKETGELKGEEVSGISERIMHCNWSSPAYGEINGKQQVIFGAGDGWTYGFDANEFDIEEDGDEKFYLTKELWKVDCCPQEYREKDGEPIKYATFPGPSEIISSPVIFDNKIYACIGQDPEHGDGVGAITCIDPSKGNGEDAIVWQFKGLGRTISTPSIADGLVYIADYAGRLFCLDAKTGELQWEHDTFSHIWGSTLVVDGKVFLGNEDGEMLIFKAGREKEELGNISYPAPIYSTAVVANDTLYVMTQTHLYAYSTK
ncbi:MAG: PQQ-binding-like beta-propeller repeat protein [Verrucomicrobiota bacterium]